MVTYSGKAMIKLKHYYETLVKVCMELQGFQNEPIADQNHLLKSLFDLLVLLPLAPPSRDLPLT